MKFFVQLEPRDRWRVDEHGYLWVASRSYFDDSPGGEACMRKSASPDVEIGEDGMLEIDGRHYKTSSLRLKQFGDWRDFPGQKTCSPAGDESSGSY